MAPQSPTDVSTPAKKAQVHTYIKTITSEDDQLRRNAIRKLGQLGPEAAAALPHLRSALGHPDFVTRLEAAIAIGFIGTKEDGASLIPLLDDEVEAVRFQTLSAIAYLKATHATPRLLAHYEHETVYVKDQILRALGHLGGPDAYSLLERELQADNPTIRIGAIVGLSILGEQRAYPQLKKVAETDSDELVAHEAKIALIQLQESKPQDSKKSNPNYKS
ncbi:MAG: HEAT repeat domain-containing protein [Candidatus Thorarchaeota archaeon]